LIRLRFGKKEIQLLAASLVQVPVPMLVVGHYLSKSPSICDPWLLQTTLREKGQKISLLHSHLGL
jgi:hypothetical protein